MELARWTQDRPLLGTHHEGTAASQSRLELRLTIPPVGSRSRRCRRLRPSSQGHLPLAKCRSHGYWPDLDKMVLCYQAPEHVLGQCQLFAVLRRYHPGFACVELPKELEGY